MWCQQRPMALPVFGFLFHSQWLMTAALVIYPVLLVGEYINRWRPYFFGGTAGWQKTYDWLFKDTLIVLPPFKNYPVANLEHTLPHSLTLLCTIVAYIAYFTAI